MGFGKSVGVPPMYLLKNGKNIVLSVVYIEENVVFGIVQDAVTNVIREFKKNYEIGESEWIDRLRGMKVEDSGDIFKRQKARIVEFVLKTIGIEHFKPITTQFTVGLDWNYSFGTELTESTPEHQLIGYWCTKLTQFALLLSLPCTTMPGLCISRRIAFGMLGSIL